MNDLSRENLSADDEDIQSRPTSHNELFSTQPSNVRTSTRITSRRITNSNGVLASTRREITFVHSFRVAATRSGSSPRIDCGAIDENGHAVFGLNLINAIPASNDLFGWINDLDAFIENNYVGLEKTQINNESAATTDQQSDNKFKWSIVITALGEIAKKEGDQNPRHNQGARGTKFFGVSHLPSFSHMEATQ